LNGFKDVAQTQTYLPAGDRDLHKNFFPTGVPVAAGGQFWMFFTSRRTYGNLKTGLVDAADAKQLWVAALKIGGEGDISYPPFYLRGQELQSGNVRAFAALEPCKADGMSCETGIDWKWSLDPVRGSGEPTLAQAFLAAGASYVIATLWRIDDVGASMLAEGFYARLSRVAVAEALAAAQRDLLHDPRYASPYYWAGFTLSGGGGFGADSQFVRSASVSPN
jgi:hypothetical protein